MIINIKKILATTLSAAVIFAASAAVPKSFVNVFSSSITASAAEAVTTPQISKSVIYSNKLELKVDNLKQYSGDTSFRIYMDGKLVKTYSLSYLKNNNLICIFHNGKTYLKPNSNYSLRICAIKNARFSGYTTVNVKTDNKTYYKVNKGAKLYELSNGSYKAVSSTSKEIIEKGILYSSSGKPVSGQSISMDSDYIKIDSGDYKGKYLKVASNLCRVTERTAKVKKVVDYGAGMAGGRYVWGGARYRATDCSGLTMQSYAQIGVNISHSVYTQARLGKSVSRSNMKAGDLLILNNYSHVAMYIGDGKMVHAMNYRDGIKIQPVSYLKYYRINTIRRII